jgi:hypothetical protein
MITSADMVEQITGHVKCEKPNPFLYTFSGNITLNDKGNDKLIPLRPEHLILRGMSLKNT